jgi:hypothetical protein
MGSGQAQHTVEARRGGEEPGDLRLLPPHDIGRGGLFQTRQDRHAQARSRVATRTGDRAPGLAGTAA